MSYKRSAESTIAGYLYQFDKSIIEILNQEDESTKVIIEGIEDIDIEHEDIDPVLVQVKYYEESEYNHSIISDAIKHLFDHYIQYLNGVHHRREYHIYGHYKSGQDKLKVDDNFMIVDDDRKKAIDILKDSFLTYRPREGDPIYYYLEEVVQYEDEEGVIINRAVTDEELNDFLLLLKVNLKAKSIHNQYEELLVLFEEKLDNCSSRKEAESFFYNNALKVIFKLAQEKDDTGRKNEEEAKELNKNKKSISEKIKRIKTKVEQSKISSQEAEEKLQSLQEQLISVEDAIQQKLLEANELHKAKRTITKKEFIELIDQKVFLFNKWYAAYKGKRKYYEYVKDQLTRKKSLNDSKNKFLIIGKEFLQSLSDTNYMSIVEFVKLVIEDSYEIGSAFATKNRVWTIVLDLEIVKYKSIIRQLIENNIDLNSGGEEYTFSINRFNKKPVVNSSANGVITQASYQIKIITLKTFKAYCSDIEDIDVAIVFMKQNCQEFLSKYKNRNISSYIVDGMDGKSLDDIAFLFEKRKTYNDYFRVISVSPTLLQIEVIKPQKFKDLNENFSLGSYIKIADEKESSVIGILKSYRIKEINDKDENSLIKKKEPSFIIDIQPIGHISNGEFKKGNKSITIPPSEVEVASNELLKSIFYLDNKDKTFCFGDLPENMTINGEKINVIVDGNKFFNKHLAVVGSTGSGKSCTVAKILQEGIKPYSTKQQSGVLNNSHIILFDLHGEYQNAFRDECRYLEVSNIKLPFWLMNSDELQDYFLDVDGSDHNQRNIFKKAVTLNKKWHNLIDVNGEKIINENITYDSPVFFNIKEVLSCIDNYNRARTNGSVIIWKDKDTNNEIEDIMPENYEQLQMYSKLFTKKLEGITGTGTNKAGLNFTNFISRLENKIFDERLSFLLKKGNEYKISLVSIIKQFIGYQTDIDGQEKDNKNITIIDLSGMPFEVVNIVVALVSRLIFKFAFERKRIVERQDASEIPFLLVYEEAHNYIPKTEEIKYKSVKEVVERIAKEGRKYGVSAMIVSQRPSEISETIFSQCNSFVVMRLTNPVDQNYIKRMLPEDISSITDNLSAFDKREALILGDAVKIPALVKVHEISSDRLPKSNDINFIQEWRKNWDYIDEFTEIISYMTNVQEQKEKQIEECGLSESIEVESKDHELTLN